MIGRHASEGNLDALAFGEPCDAVAARHVAACLPCAAALTERRRERRALSRFAEETDGEVARLWRGVEARLPLPGPALRLLEKPPPAFGRRLSASAAVLAAAAGLALWAAPRPPTDSGSQVAVAAPALEDEADQLTPSARAALSQAEGEYLSAARSLEAQVGAPAGRDGQASRGTAAAGRARHAPVPLHAGEPDTRTRLRALKGYAVYLRSLRRAFEEPRVERARIEQD